MGSKFKLSYGDAAVSGLSYAVLAQKLQADLARVGIKVQLDPMDQVNLNAPSIQPASRLQSRLKRSGTPPAWKSTAGRRPRCNG